jgi:hypothetical protein
MQFHRVVNSKEIPYRWGYHLCVFFEKGFLSL